MYFPMLVIATKSDWGKKKNNGMNTKGIHANNEKSTSDYHAEEIA